MDGFRYVRSDRTVLTVILVAMVPTLTMMSFTQTLMPVYVVRVLGDSEGGLLGILLSVMGLGGFIGTLLIATFSQVRRKGLLVTVALITALSVCKEIVFPDTLLAGSAPATSATSKVSGVFERLMRKVRVKATAPLAETTPGSSRISRFPTV